MRLRNLGVLAATLLLVGSAPVGGQEEGSTQDETPTQVWANLVLSRSRSERLYLELDIEPKTQVSGGERWRNLDLTPLVEYYPTSWIDLVGEMTVGYTAQSSSADTFEVTPRIGARFHFFDVAREQVRTKLGKELHQERLPRRRVGLADLMRLESRHFHYIGVSDGSPSSSQEWRLRNRLELRVAINHDAMSVDRTLYGVLDGEGYVPLSDDVDEWFVNKLRARVGLGYRHNARWRPELLLIRDWTRGGADQEFDIDAYIIDLKLKTLW